MPCFAATAIILSPAYLARFGHAVLALPGRSTSQTQCRCSSICLCSFDIPNNYGSRLGHSCAPVTLRSLLVRDPKLVSGSFVSHLDCTLHCVLRILLNCVRIRGFSCAGFTTDDQPTAGALRRPFPSSARRCPEVCPQALRAPPCSFPVLVPKFGLGWRAL